MLTAVKSRPRKRKHPAWITPAASFMLILAGGFWGYTFFTYDLVILSPVPPFAALLAGSLLVGIFHSKRPVSTDGEHRAASMWLSFAALLMGGLLLYNQLRSTPPFPSAELAKWLLTAPWLAAGLGLGALWRDPGACTGRVSAAALAALGATAALGGAANRLPAEILAVGGTGISALAAGITAYGAGSWRLRIPVIVTAGTWSAFLLICALALLLPVLSSLPYVRDLEEVLISGKNVSVDDFGCGYSGLSIALVILACIFVFAFVSHSLGKVPSPLRRVNLLVELWCVGVGLIFSGALLTFAAAIWGLAKLDWISAVVLWGMALASLAVAAHSMSVRVLLYICWAVFAGFFLAFFSTLVPIIPGFNIAGISVRNFLLIVLLLFLALVFGLLVPSVLGLMKRFYPERVPCLWSTFQLAMAGGVALGSIFTPLAAIDAGAGICVLAWLHILLATDTWYDLSVIERQYLSAAQSNGRQTDNIFNGLGHLQRIQRSFFTEAVACGYRVIKAIERALFKRPRHVASEEPEEDLPEEISRSQEPLPKPPGIFAAPVKFMGGTVRRFAKPARFCWRRCSACAHKLSQTLRYIKTVTLQKASLQQKDTRHFRLLLATSGKNHYALSGALLSNKKGCSCTVFIPVGAREFSKRVFVTQQYAQEQAAIGIEPRELEELLLRAAFRITVADLMAGRIVNRNLNLEKDAPRVLASSQDRWCEFRNTAASALGKGTTYVCSLAYPSDSCHSVTTLEACRHCNVPELWERCSHLVILGTAGVMKQDDSMIRTAYFTCPKHANNVASQECISLECFTPSTVKQAFWVDFTRTE